MRRLWRAADATGCRCFLLGILGGNRISSLDVERRQIGTSPFSTGGHPCRSPFSIRRPDGRAGGHPPCFRLPSMVSRVRVISHGPLPQVDRACNRCVASPCICSPSLSCRYDDDRTPSVSSLSPYGLAFTRQLEGDASGSPQTGREGAGGADVVPLTIDVGGEPSGDGRDADVSEATRILSPWQGAPKALTNPLSPLRYRQRSRFVGFESVASLPGRK